MPVGDSSCQSLGFKGFPGGSDSEESPCHVGDLGLIPGSGGRLRENPRNSLHCISLGPGCPSLLSFLFLPLRALYSSTHSVQSFYCI